ncbi:Uncharacterised protein [Chlamydia abortus]|nr:Uncharacterised protein [Chlamydia abortus]
MKLLMTYLQMFITKQYEQLNFYILLLNIYLNLNVLH